ncbi:MAG: acyl-CoA thioesterase [Bacteroidetes bacterium]|nr:acyl-CoA thioesterase [Bacteroidota bacterium]
MDLSTFKHKTRIQVRFKDIDKLGHVNNANHLTYFELSRVNYLADVIKTPIDWSKDGIILARIEVDYKSPILLEDEVWVYAKVSRLGTSSYDMDYVIVRIANDVTTLAALGKSVQVCFNYETSKPIKMPPDWRAFIENFER